MSLLNSDAIVNIKPYKEKSSEKTDGTFASIMVLSPAQRRTKRGSVYDERGCLVFGGHGDW